MELAGEDQPDLDHPRIRGEHLRFRRVVLELVGSSPHTRGAHVRPYAVLENRGIIPAYAGSTSEVVWELVSAWDHPRIRGEHP